LTVSGQTAPPTAAGASSVTVNGSSATLYSDRTYAKSGVSFSTGINTFAALATQTGTGTQSTATSTINIPGSEPFGYDLDGNLIGDGLRYFDYDDQDQLIRVANGVNYKSEFTYDGLQRRRIAKDFTCGLSSSAMITAGTLGTATNTYSGWVGVQITVGSGALLVTDLGRWVKSGNSGIHVVKLVAASSGADVPGGSVSINTSGATSGQYAYATLAAPILLQPSTTYYILSQEVSGGDSWYSATTALTPASGVTIPGGCTEPVLLIPLSAAPIRGLCR
jgi:YD repeat-containing protein